MDLIINFNFIIFCAILQDNKRDERKKLADEEAMRKIKQLEEQTNQLQKQVATHKQVSTEYNSTMTDQEV